MTMFVRRSPMFVKRFLKSAVPARAVVGYLFPDSGDGGAPTWDNVDAELRITVDGRQPYSLTGIFNGDKKVAPFAAPGTDLPVRVDPEKPTKVAIDWKQWKEEGGGGGDRDAAARANQEALQGAKSDEAPTDATGATGDEEASFDPSSWQGQFRAGLDEALKLGNISEAEYEQAKRDAGL